MSSYYYRGKKYKRQPPGQKAWRTVKKIANRVLEATSGDHPGGAEALVERMIREYPGKPTKAAAPKPETPKPEALKPEAPKLEQPEASAAPAPSAPPSESGRF
jgi:hypothetical protein